MPAPDYLVKRASPLHGNGIFSFREIRKGEIFYVIPQDRIISHNTPHSAQIGPGKFIWDEKLLNFVNHSCNPNALLDTKQVVLVAKRDIHFGEEITCDYDLTEEKGTPFICRCGAKNCRSIIGKSDALAASA